MEIYCNFKSKRPHQCNIMQLLSVRCKSKIDVQTLVVCFVVVVVVVVVFLGGGWFDYGLMPQSCRDEATTSWVITNTPGS